MAPRVQELLAQQAADDLVGRTTELAVLAATLAPDGPAVIHVHGIGGVGKSALLESFTVRARATGATVIQLDCRAIEPTEMGFLQELGEAIGGGIATPDEAAARLGRLGDRAILALDTYEVFRLLDSWLHQSFIPLLERHVRVVLAGREAPHPNWLLAPGWAGLVRSLELGPLDEACAAELVARAGLPVATTRRILRFAHGYPLALRLAITMSSARRDLDIEVAAIPSVVAELTRLYLDDIADPLTRQALAAAAVVRRVTHSLLGALLPATAPGQTVACCEERP